MNLSGSYRKGYSQHLQYLDSIKSSTKDLSLPLHEIVIHPRLVCARADAYLLACCNENGGQHCLASMDSDLEAFSRMHQHALVSPLWRLHKTDCSGEGFFQV